MTDNNKTVFKITEHDPSIATSKHHITEEQMQRELNYYIAQKIIKSMLDNGMISEDEFNKITLENRKTFSPYLAEIML